MCVCIHLFIFLIFFLADQKVYIPAFEIRSLLPKDLGRFYRYNGSLTTPPCYQSVIWTVFHERVQISKEQVKKKKRDQKTDTKHLFERSKVSKPEKSGVLQSKSDCYKMHLMMLVFISSLKVTLP